jgi:hypothetical protein
MGAYEWEILGRLINPPGGLIIPNISPKVRS